MNKTAINKIEDAIEIVDELVKHSNQLTRNGYDEKTEELKSRIYTLLFDAKAIVFQTETSIDAIERIVKNING